MLYVISKITRHWINMKKNKIISKKKNGNKMELKDIQAKWDGTFRQPTVARTMWIYKTET